MKLSERQQVIINDLTNNKDWFIKVVADDYELRVDVSMSDADQNDYYTIYGSTLQKLINLKLVKKVFAGRPSLDITVSKYKLVDVVGRGFVEGYNAQYKSK